MALFTKILFPVDMSEVSKKLVPFVKEFIESFGAELHVVYSMNIRPYHVSRSMSVSYISRHESKTRKEAEKRLSDFVGSQFHDSSVQSGILAGFPGTEILRYAEKKGVDLIIMGHSSIKISEDSFGSVAGYVTNRSHIPVLIINPDMQVSMASSFFG